MDEMPASLAMPLSLLRNRAFALLFGAQIVSLLGSGVTTVGLALFAYQLTGGGRPQRLSLATGQRPSGAHSHGDDSSQTNSR